MTTATLERTTFATSRLLEFFSEKELTLQIGYRPGDWPYALAKELIDNALDSAEAAGVAPIIEVELTEDALTVRDNGPGIPADTVVRSLDYQVRVSDKNHYVAPTRGQLGNALKCVYAAAFVATEEEGHVEIEAAGLHHDIRVTLDRIAQEPAISYEVTETPHVRTGTSVTLHWPQIACSLGADETHESYIASLARWYAAFNPHTTFRYDHEEIAATANDWRKHRPGDPTSPHWYTIDTLRGLIAAYVAEERAGGQARTVGRFVGEFAGLAGTAKQKTVTTAAGLSGCYLHDLVLDGNVGCGWTAALLAAMQAESRAPKPMTLGVIGESHFAKTMTTAEECVPESIKYKMVLGTANGLPYVLEVAFGIRSDDALHCGRSVIVGLNFTPALSIPIRELTEVLGEQRVDHDDQVVVRVHLTSPRLEFTDRGKATLGLDSEVSRDLRSAVCFVTKAWKTAKRQADRNDRVRQKDLDRMLRRGREMTIKEAAYAVMERAYLAASSGGRLPANARQIMYQARPLVQELTGGTCWNDSSYFTQTLLQAYLREHPYTDQWNVVMDARGHFEEPHTRKRVDLGTLGVQRYVEGWGDPGDDLDVGRLLPGDTFPTSGPSGRFRFALFIEKEGFNEQIAEARLAERYDIAIMSTKGMSVTAARALVDDLSMQGVTILVVRDFDRSGFSIMHTLGTDSPRYRYRSKPNVIDLGLRLSDVREMSLPAELVPDYKMKRDPRLSLKSSGATEAECVFLVQGRKEGKWFGYRVELNAMSTDQFITFLERKFADHGVEKVVPKEAMLQDGYRRAVKIAHIQRAAAAALAELERDRIEVPSDLAAEVAQRVAGKATSWDEAVWDIVHEGSEPELPPRGEERPS